MPFVHFHKEAKYLQSTTVDAYLDNLYWSEETSKRSEGGCTSWEGLFELCGIRDRPGAFSESSRTVCSDVQETICEQKKRKENYRLV